MSKIKFKIDFDLEVLPSIAERFEKTVEVYLVGMELTLLKKVNSNPPKFLYHAESERLVDFFKLGIAVAQIYHYEEKVLDEIQKQATHG